jgi:UDP-N-acetylmuramoyl-tripeptide--D-alanyl-D-alanine ligase
MIAMNLAQVADAIGLPVESGWADVCVLSVEFDTRRITPGALFVALHGEHADGHAFAGAAAQAGAVAVLGSAPIDADLPLLRVADDPADSAVLAALGALARASVTALVREHGLEVIGVTGSSGKTSTKDLIAAVLTRAVDDPGQVIAPPESFNNELGHPYTALRATPDTRFLVLELSARGIGHISTLARVAPPRIGAVLNVGSAHIGEFGSVEAIATAKSELVQSLPSAADGGVAILNADDPLVLRMAAVTSAQVVLVGTSRDATVRALDVGLDDGARARFTLVTPEGSAAVTLGVIGAHQVGNALAAAAVGRAVGMDVGTVAAALTGARAASKWRMEITELPGGITVINDAYNANPHSMRAALQALSQIGQGRRTWAVLGEMAELGPETIPAHDQIGRLVVRLGVDRLVVVGASPARAGSGARALHLGAHLEGSWGGESLPVTDTAAALEILDGELEQGDVVLVKASRSAGLEIVALRLIAGRTGPAAPTPNRPATSTGPTKPTGQAGR